MIASCHRRSGNYQQALETYKFIHKKFPDNVECKYALTLSMLGNFSCFCCRLLTFFKINFFKISFRETIRVPNSLDLNQDRHCVGPDLGPNCLQRLSADGKERVKYIIYFKNHFYNHAFFTLGEKTLFSTYSIWKKIVCMESYFDCFYCCRIFKQSVHSLNNYRKCSKISNTFLFLFSHTMLVLRLDFTLCL